MTRLPDRIAWTGDCRPKMPRLSGCWDCRNFSPRLPNVLAKIVEIGTEIAGRHCRDCRVCRSAEIADISNPVRSPTLSPKIAGIADIAGRECVIACWDRKKMTRLPDGNNVTAETGAQKCRDGRGCWEWRECQICRPKMPRLRRRMSADIAETAEIAEIAENADISKIAEIAETVAQDCRD